MRLMAVLIIASTSFHTMKHIVILISLLTAIIACSSNKEKEDVEMATQAFVQSYFNCDYKEAARLCTSNSEQWIKFVATNVTDSDLNLLNGSKQPLECEINSIKFNNDTTATVHLTISNYLKIGAIDGNGEMRKGDNYSFLLIKYGSGWRVRLDKVPSPDTIRY